MKRHPVRVVLGSLLAAAVVAAAPGPPSKGLPGSLRPSLGAPTPFQISPVRSGSFKISRAFLNPKSNLLVVFYWEDGESNQRIFSRLFNRRGRPASGPQPLLEVPADSISGLDVAYDAADDRYFIVSSDHDEDSVKGFLVDGHGRSLQEGRAYGEEDLVMIKPATRRGSARSLKTAWAPSLNRFFVAWTYLDWSRRSDPKTGHYLTGLDASLKTVLGTRQIRGQLMRRKTYAIRALIPLDDRILWGSGEDAPDYKAGSRPMVWFSDLKGAVLKSLAPATEGRLYPGGLVNDEYGVLAAYDPEARLFLLHWTVIDSIALSQAKSAETQFRIMDDQGRFKSSLKIAPKTLAYQYRSLAACIETEDRFFLGCLEYQSLDAKAMYFWGGKILGFYVNRKGGVEDRDGNPSSAPVPLLDFLIDPNAFVNFEAVTPGVPGATLFAGYSIAKKTSPYARSLWGLILE
jgi:hypothetical protein